MQFDTWLREMKRAGKGGVRLQSATRGRAFVQQIRLPEDYSGAAFRGEIRISPDATGDAIVSFGFTTPTYDSASDTTSVSFTLDSGSGADSTGALHGDGDGDGVADFPFDILMTPSGETDPEVLLAGVLPVSGRITV